MIKIEAVSKRFQIGKDSYIQALSNISFEFDNGEIVGLIGLNGAGKTTLIKVLAGLYMPDSGNLCEEPHKSEKPLLRSLLSAGQGLYKSLTVERLIKYFGKLQNQDFDFYSTEVKELINFLDLNSFLNKKIETLSAGWKQKILVLLTFLNDPELILLDEPSSFLDFLGQKQLDELIELHKSKGKYIVYATHNLHDIEKKCDKIALIDKGVLLFFDTKENLLKKYEVQSLEDVVYKCLFSLI